MCSKKEGMNFIMKRKSNIATTLTLVFSILVIMLLPLPVVQAANFTVSKSNVSIENGKDSTITINAPTHTGRLDIVSSNSAVATVNSSNLWVENNSKTIVISAKGVGTATITIKGELYDSSTDTEENFSKTINVTVTKSANSGQTNTGGTSGGASGGTQSGGTTNNNQSSNTGSSNTGSSNTGNSNTGTSTSGTQKPSSTSKPTYSQANTKPSNSSSQVSQSQNVQSTAATGSEQNSALEQENEEQNEAQEVEKEEVENVNTQEAENNIIQEDLNNAKINTTEQVNREVSKGKIIIISVIGIIAFIIMLIGIGVSKNIFKK